MNLKVPLSVKIALRFLLSTGSGNFASYASRLAIFGLSIGVIALLLTTSIIHGFENVMSRKLLSHEGQARITDILGAPMSVSDTTINSLTKKFDEKLIPFINGLAFIRSKSKVEGVFIEGLENIPSFLSKSKLEKINDGEIILGKGISSSLMIKSGDNVFLQSLNDHESITPYPLIKSFKVRKIYDSGLKEYDNTLVYISKNDARKILALNSDQISGLIYNGYEDIGSEIRYPYYYETWKEKHELLFRWISIQKWPSYIMFGLISLVGLINLVGAITMIITEKTKQIGILMAQGVPVLFLKKVFIVQGAFVGLIGCLIGGLFTLIFALVQTKFEILSLPSDIYFIDHIPISFNLDMFLKILLFSSLLSTIASWYPVRNISTHNLAESLRYE